MAHGCMDLQTGRPSSHFFFRRRQVVHPVLVLLSGLQKGFGVKVLVAITSWLLPSWLTCTSTVASSSPGSEQVFNEGKSGVPGCLFPVGFVIVSEVLCSESSAEHWDCACHPGSDCGPLWPMPFWCTWPLAWSPWSKIWIAGAGMCCACDTSAELPRRDTGSWDSVPALTVEHFAWGPLWFGRSDPEEPGSETGETLWLLCVESSSAHWID